MSKGPIPKSISEAIEQLENLSLENLEQIVDDLRPHVKEVEEKARKVAKEAIDEKPLMTLGLTALVFFLIGLLLAQSGKRK
jgi:ElaB/YqjD/DUF883 family membrane-anchored ribosome-binding protein